MLANALRETRARNHLARIKTHSDVLVSSLQVIAQTFRDYYVSPYQLGGPSSSSMSYSRWEAAREYFPASGMPTVPDEIARDLDVPITVDEFLGALKSLKSGKAPDPDGYTLSYYKIYSGL